MNRSTDILNELQTLDSPLARMPWQVPFMVPEGYFAALPGILVDSNIAVQNDDIALPRLATSLPFVVPEGYFTGLAHELTQRAIEKGEAEKPATPFEVPDGYINDLPAKMLAAVKLQATTQGPRQISLYPPLRRLVRLAAAAVLVLGIGFGSYRYLHPVNPENLVTAQLSKLDDGAIDAYVEQHVDEFDAENLEATILSAQADVPPSLPNVGVNEIQEYLQENSEIM